MNIKTDFLSKLLYGMTIGGIITLTVILIGLPWLVEFIFLGSLFYEMVDKTTILGLLYITGIPAWVILWMTMKLAQNIIKRDPFCKSSVGSLKGISLCALFIFIGYAYTSFFIQKTFGILVITMGAFVVALIAAILYRLVQLAIEIKEENELTI